MQTFLIPRGGEALAQVKRGHLVQLPLPEFGKQTAPLELLVDTLLCLHESNNDSSASQDGRFQTMLAYWERILNGLVYELYFPEEVHSAGLHMCDLIRQVELPEVDKIPQKERLSTLRKQFEELHDGTHPLRKALDKLQTIETVRIIEGKS